MMRWIVTLMCELQCWRMCVVCVWFGGSGDGMKRIRTSFNSDIIGMSTEYTVLCTREANEHYFGEIKYLCISLS